MGIHHLPPQNSLTHCGEFIPAGSVILDIFWLLLSRRLTDEKSREAKYVPAEPTLALFGQIKQFFFSFLFYFFFLSVSISFKRRRHQWGLRCGAGAAALSHLGRLSAQYSVQLRSDLHSSRCLFDITTGQFIPEFSLYVINWSNLKHENADLWIHLSFQMKLFSTEWT